MMRATALLLLLLVQPSFAQPAASSQPTSTTTPFTNPDTPSLLAIMNERDKRYDERDKRYEQRFTDQDRAVQAALVAAQEKASAALQAAKDATSKSEDAYNKRFEGVNEFRNTLKDQQITLMPRAEADIRFKAIEEKMATLTLADRQALGRTEGVTWLWGVIVAAVGVVGGLVIAFVSRRRPA